MVNSTVKMHGKKKNVTGKDQALSARKQKRIEWWSVRSEKDLDSKKDDIAEEQPLAKKITENAESDEKKDIQKKKKKAFVVFVGNLPYTVTADDIKEHFSKTCSVKEIRLLTKKDTNESRGCAYVEFENRSSHMYGLKLNESMLGGRKINVEFTSRGRNTPLRMDRLKEKNKRASRFRKPNKDFDEE